MAWAIFRHQTFNSGCRLHGIACGIENPPDVALLIMPCAPVAPPQPENQAGLIRFFAASICACWVAAPPAPKATANTTQAHRPSRYRQEVFIVHQGTTAADKNG